MATTLTFLIFKIATLLLFTGTGLNNQVSGLRQPFACNPLDARTRTFRFCSASLPLNERVRDLIGQLTLPEKARLLGDNAAPVPRLGISGYEWWNEALHGVSSTGPGVRFGGPGGVAGATSFPQVILTAASFNETLWEEIGKVVSTEGRAMYNLGAAGLTFWSPNINIFRDPRWGRGQETPGEDPVLAGKYAASYVRGLQDTGGYGKDPNRLKVAACCKHYTAYDLDNWRGNDRFHFNAKVSMQDLGDTYQVPFRECVIEGRAASVMCSYNQVNGIPTCADPALLKGVVRGAWGLNGYVVSDCDSLRVFFSSQHYTATPEDTVAAAIRAGLDLDCGTFLPMYTEDAVRKGKISEREVDNALGHILAVQMRLGMFDAASPFGQLGAADICTPAHQELAVEAARQGIVLLKNDANVLPLSPQRYRNVAVIGPNSDATVTMIGNYAGVPCGYTSPLQGISKYARTVHNIGCRGVACVGTELFSSAVIAARRADATFLIMGLDQTIEAEARDRDNLLLPGRQMDLIKQVSAAARGPVILVLMSGGPVDVSAVKNDPKVPAMLWVGYPGQGGGAAIADVIFGASSPGGKLPMTWYPQDFADKVPMTNMAMRSNRGAGYPGRTYRFFEGEPIYSFGYGLSYTTFTHTLAQAPTMISVGVHGKHNCLEGGVGSCGAVRISHARCSGLFLDVQVDIANTGTRDGSQVLMVYSTPPMGHQAPVKQLVAFERVHLPAGGRRQVKVAIDVCKDLSIVDGMGIQRLPMGDHVLQIGDVRHAVSLQVGVNT